MSSSDSIVPWPICAESSTNSIAVPVLACECTNDSFYTVGDSGGVCDGQRHCRRPAAARGGGLHRGRTPLPGLLRHEPLQQGQLVHGAEFHGADPARPLVPIHVSCCALCPSCNLTSINSEVCLNPTRLSVTTCPSTDRGAHCTYCHTVSTCYTACCVLLSRR